MSRDPLLKIERNNKIKSDYEKLAAEKVHGVEKYRYEAILMILSKRFYLAPGTIRNILTSNDTPANQLNLFQ